MLDKKALRREIGLRKRAMTAAQIEDHSRELAGRLYETELYKEAKSLYCYLPYNQEVRTWPILARAKADGKRVAVPKVYGNEMKFLWLDDFTQVAEGAYTIPEPVFDEPVAGDETALIIMPGLAFDPAGHRVGYGGGFYDRYLEAHPHHRLVALCYPFQLFDHLVVEDHDVPVDLVICAGELKLIHPTPAYAEQITDYRLEFLEAGDSMDGTGTLRKRENAADWLADVDAVGCADTVPEGLVQATQFLCVREGDDRIVGMIDVRHRLNDYLRKYAGNIGYSVRPSERRKGYATRMLRLALPHAREIGLNRVLITCHEGNIGSRKAILSNGGVFESIIFEPEGGKNLERYWIELQ